MASTFNEPNDQQRLSIVGATGSGKTYAAMWHLSRRDYDVKPWIIYNFKRDELIDDIEGARELSVDAPIPDRPGIYIVHPDPSQGMLVESQMWEIWHHENVGVYIDEGFMVDKNSKALQALLTQGRSKHIPMINLSQRPVWLNRFVLTEADFFQVFRLQHQMDRKKMEEFIPNPNPRDKHPIETRLPEFWSWYYDVAKNRLQKMQPVPDGDAILDTFRMRLARLPKVI